MSGDALALIELILVFGLVGGFVARELWALREDGGPGGRSRGEGSLDGLHRLREAPRARAEPDQAGRRHAEAQGQRDREPE